LIASQSNQEVLCMKVDCVQKVFLQEHKADLALAKEWRKNGGSVPEGTWKQKS
jgi:hypothetical protein